ncbi:MAG: hypothetical protein JXP34_06660, partial [Planctomycetes bacterium]|nr:hypothetical protein [Planctomycetota bacterium]
MPKRPRRGKGAGSTWIGLILALGPPACPAAGGPAERVDLRRACERVTVFRDCFRGGTLVVLPVPDPRGKTPADLCVSWASDLNAVPTRIFRWDGPHPLGPERCVGPSETGGILGVASTGPAGWLIGSGDFDGDGLADLALHVSAGANESGEFRILLGKPAADLRILLPDLMSFMGTRAGFVGDVDGDGTDEFAISWWAGEDTDPRIAGITILFGRSVSALHGPVRLEEIVSGGLGAFVTFDGLPPSLSFTGCGDLDGDGIADLAVASSELATIVYGCRGWPAGRFVVPENLPCGGMGPVILYDRDLREEPRLLCLSQGVRKGLLFAFVDRDAPRERRGAILLATGEEILEWPDHGVLVARERFTDGRQGATIGVALSPAGDFDGDGYEDVLTACRDPDGTIVRCLLFGGEDFFSLPSQDVGAGEGEPLLLSCPLLENLDTQVPPAARIDGDDRSDLVLPFKENGRRGAFIVLGGSRWLDAGTGTRFRR